MINIKYTRSTFPSINAQGTILEIYTLNTFLGIYIEIQVLYFILFQQFTIQLREFIHKILFFEFIHVLYQEYIITVPGIYTGNTTKLIHT